MSRNFELLQRLGEEQEIFRSSHVPPRSATLPLVEGSSRVITAPVGKDIHINRLVQRLFFAGDETSRLAAAVCFCAVDGSRQNNVCARVAELMAQTSALVCAVDMDFSAPTLDRQFGIAQQPGIADALTRSEPIDGFGHRVAKGLTIFPVGTVHRDVEPATLSNSTVSRFAELRAQFDYVLVQSPPLTMLSHVGLLGQLSDGVVLVVEAHNTRRDLAAKLSRELLQSKVPVLGAVFNNRTYPIPQSLYSKLF